MPGRKAMPTALRLITDTVGKIPLNESEPEPTGRPIKPSFVKGKSELIWNQYIDIAYWLTAAESHSLGIWCCLTAEAEKSVAKMTAARLTQWRTLAAELGFLPASRTRIKAGKSQEKPEDPTAKFYA